MVKMSEIKKLIASKKITNDDLFKLVSEFGDAGEDESDEELEDLEESEIQSDSEDSGDADVGSANKDSQQKTKGTPKLTLDDLDKLIEDKINKITKKASKKPKTKPAAKNTINQMRGGIEFADFGIIPTKFDVK